MPIRIRWFGVKNNEFKIPYIISYLERMGFFLQREEYQCVNSDQKHSANGQSTKRCPLVSLMLEQNGQLGLEILFILYNKLFVHDTL